MSTQFCLEESCGIELKNLPYDFSYTFCDDGADVIINELEPLKSMLEKRKFGVAFDQTNFDDERYGQHIATDFFEKNMGHLAIK